jgi:tetratricopeptide (TPR) repeat protein
MDPRYKMASPRTHAGAPPAHAVLLAVALLVPAAGSAESPAALVARGDAAWSRRAAGAAAGRAAAGPIAEAVTAYRLALDASPDDIAVRERLLRALYFQGRFAAATAAERRAVYARGSELAEQGIARLVTKAGVDQPVDPTDPESVAAAFSTRPEAAALFFWAAAHWGLWGETSGAFAAARQGVAGRVRDCAESARAIDERYERGGALRILGRLHTEAPRIPLVTGWVSRELAVSSLERAVRLAPEEPLNRLYLADALLRFRPRRRHEALAMLERLVAELPRAGSALEDGAILADARGILAQQNR